MRNRMMVLTFMVLLVLAYAATTSAWCIWPPSPPSPAGKKIFVSSQTYTGNLGGLDGADALCQDLAVGAKLKGTFKAWLSASTESAADRLTHSSAAYIDTCSPSHTVAADWVSLTSGTLQYPITCDESHGPVAHLPAPVSIQDHFNVWTSTDTAGLPQPPFLINRPDMFCNDWTYDGSDLIFAQRGSSGETGPYWTGVTDAVGGTGCECSIILPCALRAHLYCVEQ